MRSGAAEVVVRVLVEHTERVVHGTADGSPPARFAIVQQCPVNFASLPRAPHGLMQFSTEECHLATLFKVLVIPFHAAKAVKRRFWVAV